MSIFPGLLDKNSENTMAGTWKIVLKDLNSFPGGAKKDITGWKQVNTEIFIEYLNKFTGHFIITFIFLVL